MASPLERRLLLGGLPGPDRLAAFANGGLRRLVNVSGVDLADIYGPAALAAFAPSNHFFADVFSEGEPLTDSTHWNAISPGTYLARTDPPEQQALLEAIAAVHASLVSAERVFVFCTYGQGRSPLVAAAALLRLEARPVPDILNLIQSLQPAARFTDLSLAALRWSLEQAGGGRP
ncbi:hypothetical protein [Methylomagnum sp.]